MKKAKLMLAMVLGLLFVFLVGGIVYSQTVDPKDLKKGDPKPPSLKTTPPPPLPPKEPTLKDKIEKEIKDKLEPKQGQPFGAERGEAEILLLFEIARCVQLPVACTRNSDCTCSGCCSNWGVCQPSCHSDPILETVSNQQIAELWTGLCTKCNTNWTSSTKPTQCPNCKNVAIIIKRISENINSNIQVAQIPNPPCVCAYCGWKCGTGHASNCIYKQKVKDDDRRDLQIPMIQYDFKLMFN